MIISSYQLILISSRLATTLQYLSFLPVDHKKEVFVQQVQSVNSPAYVGEKYIQQKVSVDHLSVTQFQDLYVHA